MIKKKLNFALIGVAGYIAPRHLKAIEETGNKIVAAVDPHESVGILDKYGYEIKYFKEIERFDRYMYKTKRENRDNSIEWVSVCSPNYLHDAHIRLAMRNGADVICEKPIVINPWNLDALRELEEETGKRVFTVLQLRVHPKLLKLKEKIENKKKERFEVEVTYITPRGGWYHHSWKGKEEYSGGIAVNIGVHLFDLLMWLFGNSLQSEVHYKDGKRMTGALILKNADVKWFLSINKDDLFYDNSKQGSGTLRKISINGEKIEFSEGFTDLHTILYQKTLEGNGFGIEEARKSIELVYKIRTASFGNNLSPHPLLSKINKI